MDRTSPMSSTITTVSRPWMFGPRGCSRCLASVAGYPGLCGCRELWLCFNPDPFPDRVQAEVISPLSSQRCPRDVRHCILLTWPAPPAAVQQHQTSILPSCRSPLDTYHHDVCFSPRDNEPTPVDCRRPSCPIRATSSPLLKHKAPNSRANESVEIAFCNAIRRQNVAAIFPPTRVALPWRLAPHLHDGLAGAYPGQNKGRKPVKSASNG